MAAKAIVLSPTTVTCTRQRLVSCTWRVCGRLVDHVDERLVAYASR